MSDKIAVIGGSRFGVLKNLVITHSTAVSTPYGEPSAPLSYGILGEHEVVYLPRRGSSKPMPPHEINFRANLWALRDAGVKTVIATAAVAGIQDYFKPGEVVIPSQLIDYTYGRENTFLGEDSNVTHILFGDPYSETLRQDLIEMSQSLSLPIKTEGVYGITQGPRFETKAEINRLAKDGCQLVGMTGMPEAALACELNLDYACIALVIRKAADDGNTIDEHLLEKSDLMVEQLVEHYILTSDGGED